MNQKIYFLLPRRALTRIMFFLARIRIKWIKNALIFIYMRITGARTDFAIENNPYAYPDLDAFFTRAIRPELRPIEANIVSPVDGRCAIYGRIEEGQMLQAKGMNYRLEALLGGEDWAQSFSEGQTATLYLAPDDYHRIHMPCDGRLLAMRYCPGDVHSVGLKWLNHIPHLFASNERLICLFETEYGLMAMVLVGALNVASIETVWQGAVRSKEKRHYHYQDQDKRFQKGEEIAQFHLGSTVILLWQKDQIHWREALLDGQKIQMGQTLADAAR